MARSSYRYWSTDDIIATERFEYWRDSICSVFDPMSPELQRTEHAAFRGQIHAWELGGNAALMDIRATSHETGRSSDDIARGSHDYVFLYRQHAEAWFNFDYQEDLVTRAGNLVFGDADRSFRTAPTPDKPFHHVVLKVPRSLFEPVLTMPQDVRTSVISAETAIGNLLSSYFDSFVLQAPNLDPAEQIAALQAMASLTAAALNRTARHHDGQPAIRAGQLQAAKQMIARFVLDPELGPATVAAHLGISVRMLHRLFEESGTTVSRYIVARRLDAAAARLTHPDYRGETVLAIALQCGFDSLATFYRTFKQAYGLSPAEYRARHY